MSKIENPHTVIIDAGAVGGYTGGHLVRAGFNVTFVDPWPEHIEQMRSHGIRVSGTQGDFTLPVNALHIAEVQRLVRTPVNIAIIATKLLTSIVKRSRDAKGTVHWAEIFWVDAVRKSIL